MQVTQVTDHVTHAVIGQNKAMEAEIASTAEFFNVLSNTLYSRKEEAVCREVLCNAWDSHIQSGCTDKPIKITLTDTSLTIRDYGSGIKPEDMKQVYLTYGNSTKKNDGTQTGGFGLGSKAPWAYVDHFRVTSYCNGTKTVYALSKSSAEVAGKPSAQVLVSVPTTETGLEVTINIKNHRDMIIFRDLIKRIVSYGEMYAEYNGSILPALPFSEAKHGYLIVDEVPIKEEYIYVRYGNVIYPIPDHADYAFERKRIRDYMHSMGWGASYYSTETHSIVLQSKPNTISVTPSRESLSMTDYTVKALKELMADFSGISSKDMRPKVTRLADQALDGLQFMDTKKVFSTSADKLLNVVEEPLTFYATSDDLAKRVVTRGMPDYKGFAKRMFIRRLNLLAISGFGDRGLVQSYRDAYRRSWQNWYRISSRKRGYNNQWSYHMSNWFMRRVVAPLAVDMPQGMNIDKLFVYGNMKQNHRKGDAANYRTSTFRYSFIQANRVACGNIESYLPFLRNVVILAYNRMDVDDRAAEAPEFKFWLGDTCNSLVYIVPRTTSKVDLAREFFKARGMTVVDLTVPLKGESIEVIKPIPKPKPVKPRLAGLPKLSSINTTEAKLRYETVKSDTAERITDPKFVFYLALTGGGQLNNSAFNDTEDFTPESIRAFISLYGEEGGIVVNMNQRAKYKGAGAMEFDAFLIEKLLDAIKNNTKLRSCISMSNLGTNMDDKWDDASKQLSKISQLAIRDADFAKQLSLTYDHDDNTLLLYGILQDVMKSQTEYGEYKEVIKAFKAITRQGALFAVYEKLKTSKLVGYIDFSNFTRMFQKTTTATEKSGFKDLLIYALEG